MASQNQRPAPFPPGFHLSEHYTIEGLVRYAEGRQIYLANDDRPDRPRRYCWECGSDDTARHESRCVSCGADLSPRRFLVAARWDASGFDPFVQYFHRRIEHPAIANAVDMFFQGPVLCTVTPWKGEGLLLDEAAPFPTERVLYIAQRCVGMLAFLHARGVSLDSLARGNFLVRGDEIVLFDPGIAGVHDGAVPEADRGLEVPWLAAILRRFTGVSCVRLHDFFLAAEEGAYPSPLAFGRALEALLREAPLAIPRSVAAMTDLGLIRALNEDNWGWAHLRGNTHLFVVADGMGGHDKGEVASQIAVATICHEGRNRLQAAGNLGPEVLERILEDSFQRGNNAIKDHSESIGSDMGTTMVACLVHEGRQAYVANVGDSRAYLLRDGVLHQVSKDHSLVARLVEQNRLSREDARHYPHSNVLLRTVGTERNVEIDIFSVELESGDRLLLCSDGLWGEVEDEDIESILNHYEDPRVACRELVRAAHHGGGKDNVTVLVIGVPVA
jgi:serine/threonine protein phosphatase PrpC